MPPHSESCTIVLTGMRASGKSTIGLAIAKILNSSFLDLDDVVASGFAEPSIAEIWKVHGEAAWRAAEVRCLEWVLIEECDRPAVLALGGGVPCCTRAREVLSNAEVIVVYLHAPPELLIARLQAATGDRPTLTGAAVSEEVAAVLASRAPVYRQVADIVVDVEDRSPTDLADTIIGSINL